MTQANKKHSPQASAPKLAAASNKAQANAENVLRMSNSAMQDFFATSTGEAQKAQQKAFALSRESAENFAKSSDQMSKFMSQMVAMSRDNMETLSECGNMAASMIKDISSEAFEGANKSFADSVEISREFFACRTFSDMFDLQNRIARSSIDNFFNQSMKFSNKFFEYSTEALEPINERASQVSEQFSKAFAE